MLEMASEVDRRALTLPVPQVGMSARGRKRRVTARGDPPNDPVVVPPTPYRSDPETAELRRVLKEVRLDLIDLRRTIAGVGLTGAPAAGGSPVRVDLTTPAFDLQACPSVSVITALFNHEGEVAETLDSTLRSALCDFEIIVVDDGSTDGSAEIVRRWAIEHPECALLLVRHPVNRGLGQSRNTALDFCRGESCFVLDSDNALLPNSLGDLHQTLEHDKEASFAYGMLAMHRDGEPIGLNSWYPWETTRLRLGNYVDAMAMFRTKDLRVMGGYSTDRRLYGWEDYDLYCRLAEQGRRGAFIPTIVGRYRVSQSSVRSISDLSYTLAFEAVKEHCPRLMRRVEAPL